MKGANKRVKKQAESREIIFARHIFYKTLNSEYMKDSQDSITRKQRTQQEVSKRPEQEDT